MTGERIFTGELLLGDWRLDAFLRVSPRELSVSRIEDLAKPVFSSISRREHPASYSGAHTSKMRSFVFG
jgi:hypothetical protein